MRLLNYMLYSLQRQFSNQISIVPKYARQFHMASPTSVSNKFASPEAVPAVRSIIFDFDGIIVDSETIFYEINQQACAHFGVEYTKALKHGQMGRKITEAVDYLLKNTGLTEKGVKMEDYLDIYEQLIDQMVPGKCTLMPGACRLIQHLSKHKIQMAICTGSSSDEFPKKTDHCQDLVDKMSTVVLAGDDPEVKIGKPSPDPYLVTMNRMNPRPEEPSSVLVFEDSINGVFSGLAAGCRVVWVPQKEMSMDDGWEQSTINAFRQKHPNLFAEMLDSLEMFKPEKYGLPAYDD